LVEDHEHHRAVHRFFRRRPFAICPTTQLGVLRFLTRPTRSGDTVFPPLESPAEAWRKLKVLCNTRAKPFVPDDVNACQAPFEWVTGYL
jgi:predicted nucleic acid-binding protein